MRLQPSGEKARIQQRGRVAADIMWRIVDGRSSQHTALDRDDGGLEAIQKIDHAAAHEQALEARFASWLAATRQERRWST